MRPLYANVHKLRATVCAAASDWRERQRLIPRDLINFINCRENEYPVAAMLEYIIESVIRQTPKVTLLRRITVARCIRCAYTIAHLQPDKRAATGFVAFTAIWILRMENLSDLSLIFSFVRYNEWWRQFAYECFRYFYHRSVFYFYLKYIHNYGMLTQSVTY